jgi:hypothetical protein
MTPRCRNKYCRERLLFHTRHGLCPSCVFLAKVVITVGLFAGSVIGGVLLSLFPSLKELLP